MSTLTYNGVDLPFAHTDDISFENVEQDTHYSYTRVSIGVTATLTPDIPGLMLPGESWAECVRRVQHKLEEPRKSLVLNVEGEALLAVGAGQDVQNGPLPKVLSITDVAGKALIVRFRVVAHKKDCDGSQGPGWLSHTWRESVSIREDFLSERTRSGTIRLRSNSGVGPDLFRGMVTPPVPVDFVRTVTQYETQADGLAVSYQFTDVEKTDLPPSPAVKASGRFAWVSTDGVRRFADVTVRLIGEPKSSRKDLIQLAVAIAMARLDKAQRNKLRLVTGSLSEDLYGRDVTVSLSAETYTGGGPIGTPSGVGQGLGTGFGFGTLAALGAVLIDGLKSKGQPATPGSTPDPGQSPTLKGLDSAGFGEPLPYHDGTSPDPGIRGPAGLRLLAAALRDPCLSDFAGQQGDNALVATAPTLVPIPADRGTATLGGGRLLRDPSADDGGSGAEYGGGDYGRPEDDGFIPVPTDPPKPDWWRDGFLPPGSANYGAGTAGGPRGLFTLTTVGRVSAVPGLLASEAPADLPSGGVYTDYEIEVEYLRDRNTVSFTEAAPGGKSVYVPVCGEKVTARVRWTAERQGDAPEVPTHAAPDSNSVVIGVDSYVPPQMHVGPDGVTCVWRAHGAYALGFKDPALVKPGSPVAPWVAELMGLAARPVVFGGPVIADPNPGTTLTGTLIPLPGETTQAPWQREIEEFRQRGTGTPT